MEFNGVPYFSFSTYVFVFFELRGLISTNGSGHSRLPSLMSEFPVRLGLGSNRDLPTGNDSV